MCADTLVCYASIGFTLNGTVKLLDFGLARLLENAESKSNDVYTMSGETGSLRYMAPGTFRILVLFLVLAVSVFLTVVL